MIKYINKIKNIKTKQKLNRKKYKLKRYFLKLVLRNIFIIFYIRKDFML